MPQFKDLPDDFRCPYHRGCPYLQGLSTDWVFGEYQRSGFLEGDYERQLEAVQRELDQERQQRDELEQQ
jgi:hypothetical protein